MVLQESQNFGIGNNHKVYLLCGAFDGAKRTFCSGVAVVDSRPRADEEMRITCPACHLPLVLRADAKGNLHLWILVTS